MASSGVIDSDYRGEWMIPLINLGPEDYQIKAGDRVAQVVFVRYEQPKFLYQEDLPVSSRDIGGFGSTGV
jgi:dUTP pyrophosphatase